MLFQQTNTCSQMQFLNEQRFFTVYCQFCTFCTFIKPKKTPNNYRNSIILIIKYSVAASIMHAYAAFGDIIWRFRAGRLILNYLKKRLSMKILNKPYRGEPRAFSIYFLRATSSVAFQNRIVNHFLHARSGAHQILGVDLASVFKIGDERMTIPELLESFWGFLIFFLHFYLLFLIFR